MKFNILFFVFMTIGLVIIAQSDTVIKTPIYTSYYSMNLKAPLMVTYKLVNGGGKCSRTGMNFKLDSAFKKTAHPIDYKESGFDKGHLANAEDFASNCKMEELTFRYYNCFPQTPDLNRGSWAVLEEKIRDLSQNNDTLFVLTGGFYNNRKIGNGVSVPDTCWKLVYHLRTKTYKSCTIFTNTNDPFQKELNPVVLNVILKQRYNLDITKIIKKTN